MADIDCRIGGREFILAADAIILIDEKLVLVKRKYQPFEGMWALPGGKVDINETVEEAVVREVKEETGIDCEIERLVGVYSALGRDPRGRTVSTVYKCRAKNQPVEKTEEAEEIKLFPLDAIPELAFDHNEIITAFLCEV